MGFAFVGSSTRLHRMSNTRTGQYRIRAHDALAHANRTSDPAARLRLLDWATHWLRLAEMGEKNNPVDLVAQSHPERLVDSQRKTGQSA